MMCLKVELVLSLGGDVITAFQPFLTISSSQTAHMRDQVPFTMSLSDLVGVGSSLGKFRRNCFTNGARAVDGSHAVQLIE